MCVCTCKCKSCCVITLSVSVHLLYNILCKVHVHVLVVTVNLMYSCTLMYFCNKASFFCSSWAGYPFRKRAGTEGCFMAFKCWWSACGCLLYFWSPSLKYLLASGETRLAFLSVILLNCINAFLFFLTLDCILWWRFPFVAFQFLQLSWSICYCSFSLVKSLFHGGKYFNSVIILLSHCYMYMCKWWKLGHSKWISWFVRQPVLV